MDPIQSTQIADVVQQVFTVASAAVASGFITTALTQLLKWKVFAAIGKKYPVPLAVVLSLVVSAASIFLLGSVLLTSVVGYVVFAVATLFVSTQTYELVKKAIQQITAPAPKVNNKEQF